MEIRVDRVSKWYGDGEDRVHVLDGIDLDVGAREFVCIVGPSGCGKTTLLKMMDGLAEPSEGQIRMGDRVVTEPTDDAAMVFQTFELFPWRTTLENVELGLEIRGVGEEAREAKAMDWIERVGLDGFEDHYPAELSGGMQQRVGLARALVVDPEVLLMDEPFGALDAQTKDTMQTELLQLWEDEQKTVVFVTHDIREAIFLADRIYVLSTKPSNITHAVTVEFERPRWPRRVEIETDDRFEEIVRQLRAELGLTARTEDAEPTA